MRESFRKSAIELGSGGRLTEIETKTDTDTLMRTPKCTYTLSRDTRELRTMRYLVRGYTRAMHTHRREPENLFFHLSAQFRLKLGARVGVWAVEGERGGGSFPAKICPLDSDSRVSSCVP